MIDHLFSAVLTFSLLAGGTLAVGSAMFGLDRPAVARQAATAHVKVVQLERVVIVGKRLAPTTPLASASDTEPAAPRVQ
jgi:hypothetical protein